MPSICQPLLIDWKEQNPIAEHCRRNCDKSLDTLKLAFAYSHLMQVGLFRLMPPLVPTAQKPVGISQVPCPGVVCLVLQPVQRGNLAGLNLQTVVVRDPLILDSWNSPKPGVTLV